MGTSFSGKFFIRGAATAALVNSLLQLRVHDWQFASGLMVRGKLRAKVALRLNILGAMSIEILSLRLLISSVNFPLVLIVSLVVV